MADDKPLEERIDELLQGNRKRSREKGVKNAPSASVNPEPIHNYERPEGMLSYKSTSFRLCEHLSRQQARQKDIVFDRHYSPDEKVNMLLAAGQYSQLGHILYALPEPIDRKLRAELEKLIPQGNFFSLVDRERFAEHYLSTQLNCGMVSGVLSCRRPLREITLIESNSLPSLDSAMITFKFRCDIKEGKSHQTVGEFSVEEKGDIHGYWVKDVIMVPT